MSPSRHNCRKHGLVPSRVQLRGGRLRTRCAKCDAAYSKKAYPKNKARMLVRARTWSLHKKYGISDEDYRNLLFTQGGRCAVCGLPPSKKRLSVDHDHATGRVRGLLHGSCNIGIGSFSDDPGRLILAARYLILSKEK